MLGGAGVNHRPESVGQTTRQGIGHFGVDRYQYTGLIGESGFFQTPGCPFK